MAKELSTKVSEEVLAELKSAFPVEASFNRVLLPRLAMAAQDVTEGKGKTMKVVTEAGTFFTETMGEEVDENGKKVWTKTELGTEVEGVILYERKQLRFYDAASESYTSSPVYDTDDQIIPLFKDKVEVDRGTPAELKTRPEYQGVSAKGKSISKLEDNRILYVLVGETVYQLNLRSTSMYEYMTYKKSVIPNMVLTKMGSEEKENGSVSWNQMTFDAVRGLHAKEQDGVLNHIREIKGGIEAEKAFYAAKTPVALPAQ